MNHAIDCYDSGITPTHIYDINILEAMRLADISQNKVDTTTICNCWCKTSILPISLLNPKSNTCPTVPISSLINADSVEIALATVEKEVSDSLSHLEKIGVLHIQNWMALTELLNLEDENVMHDDKSDKDICQAVLEQHQAEENGEMNSGDGNKAIEVKEKPAYQDALQAALMLKEYIADIDRFACKLKAMLQSLDIRLTSINSIHFKQLQLWIILLQKAHCYKLCMFRYTIILSELNKKLRNDHIIIFILTYKL